MNVTPLTVMSANLWNINEPLQERMRVFSAMVAELRPDVIAMQEVRPFPGSAARLQLELVDALADYHVHYSVGCTWDGQAEGLAIATREPAADVRTYRLPGGGTEPDRVTQYVRVPSGDGWVGVLNAHLAYQADSDALRVAQAEFIGDVVAELAELRPRDGFAVCGDLNATPDSAAVARLCERGGLDNPWLEISRERPSFASDNPYMGDWSDTDSWLDYILTRGVTPSALRLIDDWPAGPASDHHFLIVELGEPAGR
ncbi:endonuclease/exonuclease/phosphatase family protein [Tessaracoccus caeni]|uniref:endonuclease/exonuclease/phosphatase family protein n=1 Tax=Tessaracoccus caeni TaxID=3031239 RepID=UPI0023DC3E9C|nr:endonuclease/exonuclease/phosphatase family protein [Tessaracoccus caeni]MDF1488858.1 endonuclease/exonuclease/phosphatase family protein [Tessaracoccus caeni]